MTRFKGFDGLRALSIFSVFTIHLGLESYTPPNVRKYLTPLLTTGVMTFFVISGFLITSLLLAEKEKKGALSFKNFLMRRFLRLAPALLFFLSVIGFFMALRLWGIKWVAVPSQAFFFALFYITNFIPLRHHSFLVGHTWSLGVEEQYYLLWGLIVKTFSRKALFWAAGILFGLCVFAQNLLTLWTRLGETYKVEIWTFPAIGPILIGSFLALIFNPGKNHWERRSVLWAGLIFYLAPAVAPREALYYFKIIQSAGIGFVLLWLISNPAHGLTRFLEIPALRYTGQISYGLYVWQGFFLGSHPGGLLWVQHFPQNLALTFLTAILSYHFLEKRFLSYKDRFR